MAHRNERGNEQRYAQEDARRGGRHHTQGTQGQGHGNDMDDGSPNSPRGRNQWNDPGSQRPQGQGQYGRSQQGASQGGWDRDIDDVMGGAGREYGHSDYNDRGYGQGMGQGRQGQGSQGQRSWLSDEQGSQGGSDWRGGYGSDMPGAGMQGSGRNQSYSQHGEDRYGQSHYGRESSPGQRGYDLYGGESSGSGGRANLHDQSGLGRQGGSSGYGEFGSGSNRGSGYGIGSSGGSSLGSYQQGGSYRGHGPKQYTRSDERILEDVCERLTDDDDIDASEINVKTQGGSVTLEGTVTERWMKHRAEDLVDACSGVKQVDNRLQVKSRSSGGSQDTSLGSSGSTTTGSGKSQSQQPH